MPVYYSKVERDHIKFLKTQIPLAVDEPAKEKLRRQIQNIRDVAVARAKQRAAEIPVESEFGISLVPPTRCEYDTDETMAEKQRWFLLNIKEVAARKAQLSSKSLGAIQRAEKALVEIAQRRRELRPEEFAAEVAKPEPVIKQVEPEPESHSRRDTDHDAKSKFLASLKPTPEIVIDAAADRERREKTLREHNGTNLYEQIHGRPAEPVTPAEVTATATSLQKKYWERGSGSPGDIVVPPTPAPKVVDRDLTFAYETPSGLRFWSFADVVEIQPANLPLPRETKILMAPDPPSDQNISETYFYNPTHSVWVKR
jgi:hypothetical protein